MAADGSVYFDVRIREQVEKDLAKVEAKLSAITKQIQASSKTMGGVSQQQKDTYSSLLADAKRLRAESAKIVRPELETKYAFNELKKTFENSVMAVKDFKAEVALMSDDGRFHVDNLTEAYYEQYQQLLETAHGAERSFESVEKGITLVDRATRRLRTLLISLGAGLAFGALLGLFKKAGEYASSFFTSIDTADRKLDRTINITLGKGTDATKKALDDVNQQLDIHKSKLLETQNEIKRLQDAQVEGAKTVKPLSKNIDMLGKSFDATNGALFDYATLMDEADITGTKLQKQTNNLIKDEEKQLQVIADLEKQQKAYTNAIDGNSEAIAGNIAHIRSWRKEWEDAYAEFEQVTPGSIAGLTFGLLGTSGFSDTMKKLDALEKKQKALAAEESALQAQKAGASKEQKAVIQERLNGIDAEKQKIEELQQTEQGRLQSFIDSAKVVTAAMGDAAEAFGEVLGAGGTMREAIQALGQSMVQSAIQVYSGVADQLIAMGTLAMVVQGAGGTPPEGYSSSMLPMGLAMKVTAGILKGMLKYESGGVVPGNSRTGDKILARVNSGELILNQTQQARALAQMESGGGRPTVNVIINNNADATVSAAQDQNGDIMVMIEQKTLETMASFKGQKIIRNAGR